MTSQKIMVRRAGILAGIISLVVGVGLIAKLDLDTRQNSMQQPQTVLLSESNEDATSVEFSDIDFAKKKLLYHQLGALIADKAKVDGARAEVRTLAEQASRDETARAQRYAALLDSWGMPYQNIDEFPESQGCHGYPTFTGMLPIAEVGAYRQASGAEVDQKYFSLMIAHHLGDNDLMNIEGKGVKNGELLKMLDTSGSEYSSEITSLKAVASTLGS